MYKPSNLSLLNWFTNTFLVLLTSLLQKKNENENKNDSKSLHNEEGQKKIWHSKKQSVKCVGNDIMNNRGMCRCEGRGQ